MITNLISPHTITRHRATGVLLLFLLGLLAAAMPRAVLPAAAANNPVVTENQQAGTTAWIIGSAQSDDATGQIKGYASATSVNQNQSLTFYVTVNPAQTYTIDVYRIGWYGGAGGRLRLHAGPLNGIHQTTCAPDATTGLIACNWSPSYTLAVPTDWTSGVYVALLTNAAGYQNYIIFVVKDGRPAQLLYQQSVATYEAYNNYPNDGTTGKSLYDDNSYGPQTVSGGPRAVKVSFDRPYTANGSGHFFWWEVQAVRWLERSGFDVTYSTDVDTHENGAALKNSKGFLVVGHDEYWSAPMRDAVEAARDAGVGLAFLGSNAVYSQIRFEASASGAADRVIVCYKNSSIDPVQGPTTTVPWRAAPVNRPEQTLLGAQFTSSIPFGAHADYVVSNSSHWAYAGTGFKDGDHVAGLLGYEMDRVAPGFPNPVSTSLTILSQSPYSNTAGGADVANSVIYQAPSGAWAFDAGTTYWTQGLDSFNSSTGALPQIEQTTANILNAFLNGAPSTVDHLQLTAPSSANAGQAFSVTVTAVNAQGGTVTNYSGTVHFSSSDTSSRVALPADTTLTNGQGTFTVTLITAGAGTLTASDAANSLTSTATIQVTAAAAAVMHLSVPTSVKVNQPFNGTVTLTDQFGNLASGYRGTVSFLTSDLLGKMPANYSYTAVDGGSHIFSMTLITPPSETISVMDTANSNLNDASPPITVSLL